MANWLRNRTDCVCDTSYSITHETKSFRNEDGWSAGVAIHSTISPNNISRPQRTKNYQRHYFQSDMILSFVLFLCLTVKSHCTTPPVLVKVRVQKNDFLFYNSTVIPALLLRNNHRTESRHAWGWFKYIQFFLNTIRYQKHFNKISPFEFPLLNYTEVFVEPRYFVNKLYILVASSVTFFNPCNSHFLNLLRNYSDIV